LTCNGGAVSRSTYSTLYGIIGTTFGTGDGSTTFNLPNFSGTMPIGVTGATSSSFTGTISGTTLTVTGVGSGTVAINHVLSGVSGSSVAATAFVVGTKYQILSTSGTTTAQWIACGASDAPATGQTFVCTAAGAGTGTAYPVIAAGTTITGFVSGTLGGNGTYTVNISQTINSMTIAGAQSAIALASTGGAASTSLTPSNLPNHSHTATVSDPGHVHSYYTAFSAVGGASGTDLRNGYGYYNTGSQVTGITVSNANNGSNSALSTISPYLGIYFIIKT
jgi:microcystin-dependent protein